MRSEPDRRGSAVLRVGALPGGRASIGSGGRGRVPGIQPLWGVAARGRMRPAPAEERASARVLA
jgi:hypothetical protein